MVSDYPSPFLVGLEDNSFMEPKKERRFEMTITDEMVEKAWDTFEPWEETPPHKQIRRMLEVVAPMLQAQIWLEAAAMMVDNTGDYTDPPLARRFLALAQELDPK